MAAELGREAEALALGPRRALEAGLAVGGYPEVVARCRGIEGEAGEGGDEGGELGAAARDDAGRPRHLAVDEAGAEEALGEELEPGRGSGVDLGLEDLDPGDEGRRRGDDADADAGRGGLGEGLDPDRPLGDEIDETRYAGGLELGEVVVLDDPDLALAGDAGYCALRLLGVAESRRVVDVGDGVEDAGCRGQGRGLLAKGLEGLGVRASGTEGKEGSRPEKAEGRREAGLLDEDLGFLAPRLAAAREEAATEVESLEAPARHDNGILGEGETPGQGSDEAGLAPGRRGREDPPPLAREDAREEAARLFVGEEILGEAGCREVPGLLGKGLGKGDEAAGAHEVLDDARLLEEVEGALGRDLVAAVALGHLADRRETLARPELALVYGALEIFVNSFIEMHL